MIQEKSPKTITKEMQGELYMMELWKELGYRIAEEKETYEILADYINAKIQIGRDEMRKEIYEILDKQIKILRFDLKNECDTEQETTMALYSIQQIEEIKEKLQSKEAKGDKK